MDNSVCALLALHARDLGLCVEKLDTKIWFNNITPTTFYDDRWLLAYESVRKGWLKVVPPELTAEPLFSVLLKYKVEFYSKRARNRPVAIPEARQMIRAQSIELNRSVLPGNIYVPRGQIYVESMGGDYDEEDDNNPYRFGIDDLPGPAEDEAGQPF